MLLVFGLWLALFFPTIKDAVLIWERSETYAHCFLIFPICVYLIRRNWSQLAEQVIEPSAVALIPIVGVLILWLMGNLVHVAAVEQLTAFALLPLFYWLILGKAVCRAMLFVLFFWMFSVPEGEFLIPRLQDVTADITVIALRLSDIPVFREGLYIAVPGGLFEVAVACSGIRYLIASFSLGTLYAYLTYSKWYKRFIFIVFALLLPILANGIRAYGIVMIAYLSDMKHATGVDHLVYGWLFFGVVIFIMFSIGNIWRDPDRPLDVTKQPAPLKAETVKPFWAMLAVCFLSTATFFYARCASQTEPQSSPDFTRLIPVEYDEAADASWHPQFHNATLEYSGLHPKGALFIVFYDTSEPDKELINSKNSLYNHRYWSIVSSQSYRDYALLEITNTAGQRRLLAQSYVTPWVQTPEILNVKLSQALQAMVGQTQSGMAVVLSTTVSSETEKVRFRQQAESFFKQDFREFLND
ncbi:exosortase A [Bowmanella denitrificans]